jgi:hypothetical protein
MGNKDEHKNRNYQVEDEIDHMLDAALARYAAVEPRLGLEERVLANLRAQQAQLVNRVWRRWGIAAVAASFVVLAFTLNWRLQHPPHPPIANHPAVTTHPVPKFGTEVARNNANPVRPRPARTHSAIRHRSPATIIAVAPKLDQFPSPQPLSEQEKILARYITNDPEQAGLIAEARMDALRRDQEEEMREVSAHGGLDPQP